MEDLEAVQAAIENDISYISTLIRSVCLVLDGFYQNIQFFGELAVTCAWMDDLFAAIK